MYNMIKLKSLLLEDKKSFVGDCKTILNTNDLFSDATEMSQAIENGEEISYEDFVKDIDVKRTPKLFKLYLRKNPDKFSFGKYNNLIWAYHDDTDTHYFFI